jgi:hypothetical protein
MTGWRRLVACLLALALAAPLPLLAQSAGSSGPFSPAELEQIAAPIALYPDALLAQVLMAATYPIEIVLAERFLQANATLTAETRDEALRAQPWDDSVKSLVSFPQVLAMMSDRLEWTQKLGDAFLAQQAGLMDAVQRLRAKAHAQGALKDSKEQKVVVEVVTPPPAAAPQAPPPAPSAPTVIKIEPADPQVVYVPTYNPTTVYGGWPYPAYPPYAYYPPGYVAGAAFFSFAAGVAVGGAMWGNCDWHGGDVNVNNNQYNNFTKNVNKSDVAAKRSEMQGARGSGQSGKWQHQPEHRKGVQYRDQGTQQRFNKGDMPNAQSREAFRGRAEQGRGEMGAGDRGQGARGGQGQGGIGGRGDAGAGARGAQIQQTRGGGAFEGVGSGGQTRSFSDRGSSSRQSAAGAGGGARAGGGGGGGGARGGGSGGGGGARGGGGGGRR